MTSIHKKSFFGQLVKRGAGLQACTGFCPCDWIPTLEEPVPSSIAHLEMSFLILPLQSQDR